MRLIDADALCEGRVSNDPVVIAAKCAPSVDAEPVRHGEWVRRKSNVYCTVCNKGYRISNGGANVFKFKRCPECGAKMDGGKQDANV